MILGYTFLIKMYHSLCGISPLFMYAFCIRVYLFYYGIPFLVGCTLSIKIYLFYITVYRRGNAEVAYKDTGESGDCMFLAYVDGSCNDERFFVDDDDFGLEKEIE